jgi:hypothetical protein
VDGRNKSGHDGELLEHESYVTGVPFSASTCPAR